MRNTIICGDALTKLRTLPSGYVQTCITSPPYYGLRDYNTKPQVWDGEVGCEHEWLEVIIPDRHGDDGMAASSTLKGGLTTQGQTRIDRVSDFCRRCNAWRGSLGLEPTLDLYIQHLVQIFREVRRVLRKDGTLWCNIGDSYAGSWGNYAPGGIKGVQRSRSEEGERWERKAYQDTTFLPPTARVKGLKPKDLMMIPARLAIALQSDGWYLRQDIIWAKSNPMPESVTDRPTTSHEHIFLLAKSERYFYDVDAIREPIAEATVSRNKYAWIGHLGRHVPTEKRDVRVVASHVEFCNPLGRNKRSVWTVATQPYSEAHFATFPPKLIEPAILAGTSPRACEHCGAPWERGWQPTGHINKREPAHAPNNAPTKTDSTGWRPMTMPTDQWEPTCYCNGNEGSAKCIVLDPFFGSGTVGEVSNRLGRDWLGIELNPTYIRLAEIRTAQQGLWTPESEAV
jgi:DNA modification methylase